MTKRSSKLDRQLKSLDETAAELERELAYFRKKYSTEKYLNWLESMYTCAQLNWDVCLDELIPLRKKYGKKNKTRKHRRGRAI